VVATGARLKELGVPGEERLRGRGVSHCATCDAPLLRDKVVAVVGGGDSALQEALTLAGSAAQVVVLQRELERTAQASYRERVLGHPGIDVRCSTIVEEILGGEHVEGVRLGDGSELSLAGVFVYVGLQPNSELLDGVPDDDRLGLFPAGI